MPLDKHSIEEKLRKISNALEMNSGLADPLPVATYGDNVIVKDYGNDGELYQLQYSEVNGEIVFGQPAPVDVAYVQKQLLEQNPNAAAKDVQSLIDTWSEWAGGFSECVAALADKPGIDNPEALCAWLHYQAEGKWPAEAAANAAKDKDAELTGPIVYKNDAKRIAYAAVLVPGEPDHDGETVSAEQVEKAAHEWMELYRNVDLQHSLNNVGVPVESYLLPQAMTVKSLDGQDLELPAGTWILGSKATDDETWGRVTSGELTGYSVMGIKRTAGKSIDKDAAFKRTLLGDLGEDWVAAFVSFVDQPAVPKAKFFALKSKAPEPGNGGQKKGILQRFVESLKGGDQAGKAGRQFSDDNYAKLQQLKNQVADALQELNGLIKVAEQERAGGNAYDANFNSGKGGDADMTKEELLKAIKEDPETKEALKAALAEEDQGAGDQGDQNDQNDQGSNDQNAAGKDQDQGDAGDQDQGDQDQGSGGDTETVSKEDYDQLKADYDALAEKVEKALGTGSRSIKGQDGSDDDTSTNAKKRAELWGRDGFGRRRRDLEDK